jgi:hypothetical protein
MPTMTLTRRVAQAIGLEQEPWPGDPMPPWMDPIEFSQLLAVVHALGPKRVLEWGAGGGTKRLLASAPSVERYVSVEHEGAWADRVRSTVTDPRLELHHIAPSIPPAPWPDERRARNKAEAAWHMACEHDPAIMAEYVAFPRTLGETFDLILVDGRARVHCLREAIELVRPGGVIVTHDAQREVYRPALEQIGTPIWLDPWRQGQICIVRRD